MFPQINLFEGLSISTYFLVISLGVTASVFWFLGRAERRELARVTAIDLALVVLVAGFLGARLLHVFFEEPEFYGLDPLAALKVWNGGFVFLGGVVGAFIGASLYCRIKNEPFWYWADVATPPVALAYALGRIGCFLNGCCYGKVCELPWAVFMHGAFRHPTQLYSSAWDLVVLAALLWREGRIRTSGVLFNIWLIAMSVGRIVMEVFRDDPRGPQILGVSLGMAMSLAVIFIALMNLVAHELRANLGSR